MTLVKNQAIICLVQACRKSPSGFFDKLTPPIRIGGVCNLLTIQHDINHLKDLFAFRRGEFLQFFSVKTGDFALCPFVVTSQRTISAETSSAFSLICLVTFLTLSSVFILSYVVDYTEFSAVSLKTRLYQAFIGPVQATGLAGGFDSVIFCYKIKAIKSEFNVIIASISGILFYVYCIMRMGIEARNSVCFFQLILS